MVQKSRKRLTALDKLTCSHHRLSESALLNLPFEVRHLIYISMLDLPCKEHLNFLCASKQTFMEAHGPYSQRPLTCGSQDDFILLSSTMEPSALSKVRHLRLQLEDHKSAQMQPFLSSVIAGAKLSWRDSPYYTTSEAIRDSLSNMNGIEVLELLPPEKNSRQPPAKFINAILANIGGVLPKLRSLTVGFEHCSLRGLREMNSLRTLVLTESSSNNARTVAEVLSKLPQLIELRIMAGNRRHARQSSKLRRFSYSIVTCHLFERLRPLEKLEINEFVDSSSDGHTTLTAETLITIKQCHGPSLRELHLTSNMTPSDSVISLLKSFRVDSTTLRHLYLDFPGFLVKEV